ncbi:MAG: T9SS type A sorting domain-containing protein [Bacteroidota bacterium]
MRGLKSVVFLILGCVCVWNNGYAQTGSRVYITSITQSVSTGQDFSPWMNDDETNLVSNVWGSANMQYVDVKLKLTTQSNITKVSLYDYEGTFESTPVTIYAAVGGSRTLLGTFVGSLYMAWADINVSTPVLADSIIVRKYGNAIPHKIKIYGTAAAGTGGSAPAAIAGASTLCAGTTTAMTNATTGGAWSSSNSSVASVSAGVVTGTAAGTAVISYTTSGGTATKNVTVNPSANAGTVNGTAAVTTGATTALTNATTGGTWSSSSAGVATVSTSGMVTGIAAGTATISYTVTNGCGTAVATRVVTVSGATTGPISGTATVCVGSYSTLSSSITGGTWSSTASYVASVTSAGVIYGVTAGTTTIKYTKGTTVNTKVVTVNPLPKAGTVTGIATVAAGGNTTLANAAAPGGAWICTNPAVAAVAATGVVTGVAAGTTPVSYQVTNSCGVATTYKNVTVTGTATTSIIGAISGGSTLCAGTTTPLASTTAGGAWSSLSTGVATVSTLGVVTGVTAGTATIRYAVGALAVTKIVTVTALPAAGTISGTGTLTTGTTAALSSSVTGGAWSSSTTAIATVSGTGVVSGVSAGTAIISYTVTNSCGTARATKTVTVNAATTTTAGTITGTATVCAGSTTALANTTTGGVWSSSATGVASVNTTGVVTGVSAGTANISYTIGSAVATKTVTVSAATTAGTISGATSVTTGSNVTYTSSVSGGTWGSSATGVATVNSAGLITGVSAGVATISYTKTGTCGTAYATKSITVMTGGSSTGGGGGTGTLTYGKIPMDANRWYQLNNCTNGLQGLFDNVLTTSVNTGWGKILTNFDAYYPVIAGEIINIDSVKFYDGAGSNESTPFKLYYIDSAWNRVLIATYTGTQYNMWVGPNAATPTNFALAIPAHNVRYLVINSSSAYPYEMALYGSYKTPNTVPATPAKTIKLKQEMGVNAFEWDFEHPSSPLVINETRMNAVKAFSSIRHYLDWEKLEPTNGGYTFNPSHSGGWNMDVIYERCKADGIEVLVDIKTIPSWMLSSYTTGADAENVPVFAGADFSAPASYIKQAKLGFQFAARYGYNTSVSTSLLSVNTATRWTGDPANTVKKGLGLVKFIECDNERDKWWKGRNAYQTGREYAANMSAFYDGHKNTMGAGVGVKNADPNMQVVMGGVAMPTVDYLMGMIDWCKENRGYKADGSVNLCWDVVNYHIYPDNGGNLQGAGTRGAAPEVAHADSVAKKFIDASRAYSQDMPVWVTETGYDINPGSVVKAVAVGSRNVLATQADWVLRNSLLYARMGVERCFFYMMDDVDTNSTIKFSSCGLVNANYSRKPAADFLLQTKKLMGEYEYKETISTNPLVDRYELDGRSAYAIVKPTENGSTMSYSLPLSTTSGTAKLYKPTIGQDSMNVSNVTIAGGSVALTVSETPMFLIPNATTGAKTAQDEPTAPFAEVAEKTDVVVFPNPTSGTFNLQMDDQTEGTVHVIIYNQGGQACKQYEFQKMGGKYTQQMDISGLPNGLYIAEIVHGNERTSKKIIKVN